MLMLNIKRLQFSTNNIMLKLCNGALSTWNRTIKLFACTFSKSSEGKHKRHLIATVNLMGAAVKWCKNHNRLTKDKNQWFVYCQVFYKEDHFTSHHGNKQMGKSKLVKHECWGRGGRKGKVFNVLSGCFKEEKFQRRFEESYVQKQANWSIRSWIFVAFKWHW